MEPSATFEGKHANARELFDEGFSCRAIAEKLGVAPSTVSRWAKAEGLAFDRTQTDLATRAHTVDLAAARMELAQKLMVVSSNALDALEEPYLVYNFGGKDNTYEEHILAAAPVDVIRSTVVVAGIAIDKATRILEKDNGGLDEAVGVLDALSGNLAAAAELLRARDETDVDDGS